MKNKKAFIVLLLLCIGQLWIFAGEQGEYYDYETGQTIAYECYYYGRLDSSEYTEIGTEWIKFMLKKLPHFVNFRKLSNRSSRICWQALKVYDYNAGECYIITIAIVPPGFIQKVFVRINEDNSFSWYGVEGYAD